MPNGRCRPSAFGIYRLALKAAPGTFRGEPAVKINKATLQPRFILLPPDTIDSPRSLTLESVEAIAQQRGVNVVEQAK
jgi:hypothetical protein